jgi:hypothetical protein
MISAVAEMHVLSEPSRGALSLTRPTETVGDDICPRLHPAYARYDEECAVALVDMPFDVDAG